MRHLSLLALATLLAGCASTQPRTAQHPSLDDRLPQDAEARGDLPRDVFAGLADLRPFTVERDGIEFVIGVNDDDRVRYIETRDLSFTTPEGIGTRTTLPDFLRLGNEKGAFVSTEFEMTPDGRTVFALRSGWLAVLPDSDRLRATGADAKVEWVCLISTAE